MAIFYVWGEGAVSSKLVGDAESSAHLPDECIKQLVVEDGFLHGEQFCVVVEANEDALDAATRFDRAVRGFCRAVDIEHNARVAERETAADEQPEPRCPRCAVVLCDCGAYHGVDTTMPPESSDHGDLYTFRQSREQIDAGDEECGRTYRYALTDDEVDRLGPCSRCDAEALP